MKLLQITDTHITSENELIYSINTTKRLEYIVHHINKKHADADICMITGDLTDIKPTYLPTNALQHQTC